MQTGNTISTPEPDARARVLLVDSSDWFYVFIDEFLKAGFDVAAISPVGDRFKPYIPEAEYAALDPENWLAPLTAFIGQVRPDIILPCDDNSAAWLRDPRLAPMGALVNGGRDLDRLAIRSDAVQLAESLGVDTPASRMIRSARGLDRAAASIGFPAVLKKDGTFGGSGVAMVTNQAALHKTYARLTRGRPGDAYWRRGLEWLGYRVGIAFIP